MTTKSFDCVETVEAMQEESQEILESMSREEQLACWHAQAEQLRERQHHLRIQPLQDIEAT